MVSFMERFEHLVFRLCKEENNMYRRIALVHPEKRLLNFQDSRPLLLTTGRANWSIHMYSNWDNVPQGLLENKHWVPEHPHYNVILTPQKLRQAPAIIAPAHVLTSDSKETGFWVFTGCLRDKYYY
jgi:hypothetical protein